MRLFRWAMANGDGSGLKRSAECGHALGSRVSEELRRRGDVVQAVSRGVQTCGSVWICPVCASVITTGRASEVEASAQEWARRGGRLFMLTLTVRHEMGLPLRALLRDLVGCWASVRSDSRWRALKGRGAVVGFIRSTEVTWGKHGWHPHLHLLLFCAPEVEVGDFFWMSHLWRELVRRQFGPGCEPSFEHGADVRELDAAASAYVSKIGHEVASSQSKDAARTLHPFVLLDRLDRGEGFSWAAGMFLEYARATKGRHAIEWSKGLRAFLGQGELASDEELCAMEAEGERDEALPAVSFSRQEWNGLQVTAEGVEALIWLDGVLEDWYRDGRLRGEVLDVVRLHDETLRRGRRGRVCSIA